MPQVMLDRLFKVLLAWLIVMSCQASLAAPASDADARAEIARTAQAEAQAQEEAEPKGPTLDELSDQLASIRQKFSANANDELLGSLRQAALKVQQQADDLVARQTTGISRIDDQLNVLGPLQPDEARSLTTQRKELTAQKKVLSNEQEQTSTLSQSARELAIQIFNLRRSLFDSQISTRSASPLNPVFWSSLTRPSEDDLAHMRSLYQEVKASLDAALAPGKRFAFISVLLSAALVWVYGRRFLEQGLIWLMIRYLPEGRLRRSTLALMVALSTIVTIAAATSLLRWAVTSDTEMSADVLNLTGQLETLVLFCAFISGLGRALLMLAHSSWRLPTIPDALATAMGRFPAVLALGLLLIGTQERINSVIASSLALTAAVNGLTALIISLTFICALWRYRQVRRRSGLERLPGLAGVVPFVIAVWAGLSLLALLAGYLTLAYFLTVKLLWTVVVAATAYLLIAFYTDLCETLLSPKQPGGLALGSMIGLSARHQAQASTVLMAIGRLLLLLVALVLVFTPSGSSPGELLDGFTQLSFNNKTLGTLDIVPGDIFLAVGLMVVGLFCVRLFKAWLGEQLLPETNMDAGMRASLVTLAGYLGAILVVVAVMSTLHISLTSLTWVVSALSVGIGFGLQAIVQNFISGLILLTERPVKVGDWVSLAGVEGDIRRINVRATEIQMSDRSTVIVPNSQFITQNVRNVTMGNALGVVGLSLTLPLDTDVLKIRELLLQAYTEHAAILDTPAPSVTFKDLTSTGLIISVSGFVDSPRSVGNARSDLLFTILGRLREMGVALSAPQNMLLITDNQAKLPFDDSQSG
jgi:potassium efflux system protein